MAKRRKPAPVPEARRETAPREPLLALCVGLAVAVLVVYAPVLGFDYVSYDDPTYVTENPMVNQGMSLQGVAWAFGAGRASNWHPVTWISLMLDVSLFGLAPGPLHVVNAAFHALNAIVLLLLLRGLTGRLWASAMVAGLFAVHPMHVESVAWIPERKDVLSTLFGLLAIGAYAAWTRAPSRHRYVLALGFLALGLMSKPMLVTWPIVLLLVDVWPLRRSESMGLLPRLMEKLPFAVLAAASSVVTFAVQRAGGAVQDTARYPLPSRFANAVVSWAEYAWKAVWPHPMAFFYPYPTVVPVAKTLVAGVVLVLVTILALRAARSAPALLFGWLFYLVTLLPVIGLVQVGNQRMGDRYTYVPYIGLFVAVVFLLGERFGASPRGRRALAAAGASLLAAFTLLASRQVMVWKDSLSVYEHAIAAVPDNHAAHLNLGTALYFAGRKAEAIAHFREVVRILPEWGVGFHNLGASLLDTGALQEGERNLVEAVRLMPTRADYRVDLAKAYTRQGRTREALLELEEALKLDPADVRARDALARLDPARQPEHSVAHYEEAIRKDPGDPRLHNNLAAALIRQGKTEAGLRELAEAVRLDPSHLTSRYNLGNGLLQAGRAGEGVPHLVVVLESDSSGAPPLQAKAIEALRAAGPSARAAAPALREIGKRRPDLADAARAALRAMGATP